MSILVTGGAGYIGSHTCVELLNAGKEVVILDNFVNSKPEVLDRIRKITGKDFRFYEVDLLDREGIDRVFSENQIDAVIHFAGLKAVGESCKIPLRYYHNNLTGTFLLCEVMAAHGCKKIVFSSSATVYGMHNQVPFREDMPLSTTNPYGATKLFIEQILTRSAHTKAACSVRTPTGSQTTCFRILHRSQPANWRNFRCLGTTTTRRMGPAYGTISMWWTSRSAI